MRFISARHVQAVCLNVVRVWWRPLGQVGAAASVWVNLVYLPIKLGKSPSLAEAAAYLTALGAMFAVRAYEKVQGAS